MELTRVIPNYWRTSGAHRPNRFWLFTTTIWEQVELLNVVQGEGRERVAVSASHTRWDDEEALRG